MNKSIKTNKGFSKRKVARELAQTIIGSIIYAFTVTAILSPLQMAPGGVAGISIILHNMFPVLSVGLLIFVINIPLMILGYVKLGGKFMAYTVLSVLVIAGASEIFALLQKQGILPMPLINTPILAAFFGGALMGVGLGVVMRGTGCSGGTDIIIRVLRTKMKQVKTGSLYIVIDFCIIFASALAFKNIEIALYAAVADVVCSVVLDRIIYGVDEAKLLIIISDDYQEIADRLLAEVNTGVTVLEGTGAYTNENKNVLMLALHRSDFTRTREIVREVDPNAFLIVSSASEVFGEGYKGHYSEDL